MKIKEQEIIAIKKKEVSLNTLTNDVISVCIAAGKVSSASNQYSQDYGSVSWLVKSVYCNWLISHARDMDNELIKLTNMEDLSNYILCLIIKDN